MGLQANQGDYKSAFRKHFHAYSNWRATGSDLSKRLILVYCVECGLKYKVMKKERLIKIDDAQDDIRNELTSHDLRRLLKRLNKAGMYTFPSIETKYGYSVHPEEYHQFCRYGIPADNRYIGAVNQFDDTLEEIAKWIEEGV